MAESAARFIRLYLDEDVAPAVAVAIRRRGFDAISVHELGRRGQSDSEQLAHAAADDQTLFTFNAADFLRLHRAWIEQGRFPTPASTATYRRRHTPAPSKSEKPLAKIGVIRGQPYA